MFVNRLLPAAREKLVVISHAASVIDAAELLAPGTDLLAVCGARGSLAGVVTKSDLVRHIGRCRTEAFVVAVSAVMTTDVVVCSPRDWLNDVWSRMKIRGLKNVPIADDNARPIGLLNVRDALQHLLQEVENEEKLLRDYVLNVGYQ
jgi:CBS domain-containing protein